VVAEVEEPAVNASDEEPASSRPTWIDEAQKRVGNTWREVVVTDEYATIDECYAERDKLLMIATGEFVKQFAGANGVYSTTVGPDGLERVHQPRPNAFPVIARYPALYRMGITADYLRREIAKDEYVETVERSFGPMKKLYTLVEFSPAVDNELRQRWAAYQRQERFAIVGIGAASILGLLSLVWGLLKVDTWTKGYYTKRLFLGVPLGILGLFGLYVLLVEMGFDLPH
ncbi:MAG: hypothetical protein L0Z07_09740, partial [Planctomycetes bacterium]|nr:hypothetical protein [Planctomycetota bacterium]